MSASIIILFFIMEKINALFLAKLHNYFELYCSISNFINYPNGNRKIKYSVQNSD